jgi:peptidyl-dipeptidase Dcp
MHTDNPLLAPWAPPYELPPFDKIRTEHFAPALDEALAAHVAEVAGLASNPAPATFDNTVLAFDRSGIALQRVLGVFNNLTSSQTDEALQAAEREYAPKVAVHMAQFFLDPALFARVDAVYRVRTSSGLNPVQIRLVERLHLDFVLAGARLDEASRNRLKALVEESAERCTAFGQAVLADEDESFVLLESEADLAGLPADLVGAAAEVAQAHGHPGKWAVNLSRSMVEPFLTLSSRRDLRKKVYEAFSSRGERRADRDTKPIIRQILKLRAEQARLHGYKTFADYALVDRMAKTPAAATGLLAQVWKPALAKANQERQLLADLARKNDGITDLAAWDWRYYADQVRRRDFDLDDAEVKPYFVLDNMVKAMFWCAGRLFGIEFRPVEGAKLYHPDAKLYEVRNTADNSLQGLFLADNFARPGKRSGAWMSNYREQSAGVLPIVSNNNNFTKPAPGEPALLSFDDVETLFHEFGHGLHGLLSQVDYQGLSGTNVLRDFVELPSQLMEHWAQVPEVLAKFALHAQTRQPIPQALVEKIRRARTFNMGWETVQYLGPALLDMALHGLEDPSDFDAARFEAEEGKKLGVPDDIGLRHRLPHFQHLFSADDYAAGYYVYMWAEVLEADVFRAFEEKGDPFDPELAARLKACIYSAGNSVDPSEAFRAFRGRDPQIAALLAQRGLG